MVRRVALLCLLAIFAMPAAPAEPEPSRPEAAGALAQFSLPSLTARRTAAEARARAAADWFAGRGTWELAFPELVDAPLGDPDLLHTRLAALSSQGVVRAAERVAPAAPGLTDRQAAAFRSALEATTEAEDRADAAEVRFLSGLLAGVGRAPGLSEASVARRLAGLPQPPADAEAAVPDDVVVWDETAQDLRAWRRAAWQAMTRPDDHTLADAVEAAVAVLPAVPDDESGIRTDGLLDRLLRVRPLLDEPLAGRADVWASEADRLLYTAPLDVVRASPVPPVAGPRARAVVEEELAAARSARAAAAEAVATSVAEGLATPVHEQLLEARLGAADHDVARLAAELGGTAAGPHDIPPGTSVDDAERLAQEAQLRAERSPTQSEAEVRARTAEIRSGTAELVRTEASRRDAAMGKLDGWRTEVDRLRLALDDARIRTSLDPERQPLLDATYLGLRTVVDQLHAEVPVKRDRASTLAREEVANPWPDVSSGGGSEASEASDRVMAVHDFHRERALQREVAEDEVYTVTGLLIDAKHLRRAARSSASGGAREVGRRAFFPDLVGEVRELPAVASYHVERVARSVRALPSLLGDVTAVYALATGSAAFLIGLVAWWALRRVVPSWAATAVRQLDQPDRLGPVWSRVAVSLSERLEHPHLYRRWAPIVADLGRRLVDLGAAVVFVWWTPNDRPALVVLAAILLAIAEWRTWRPLVDLLFATPEDARPALRVVAPQTVVRIRKLVGWVVGWWLVASLADDVLLNLFAADKLTQLSDTVAAVVGLVIVSLALWAWEPNLRGAIEQLESTPLVRRIAVGGGPLTRIPRAAAAVLLLGWFHLGRFVVELAATSRRLRWVGTAMARRQLAPTSELAPLDEGPRATIDHLEHGVTPQLRAAIVRVSAALDRWKADGEGGMVAVTSERGAGLKLLPDLLSEALRDVRRVRPPHRLSDAGRARTWLAGALGLPADEDNFVPALRALPPSTIVLEDGHLLFVRTAGGFDALRWVLETMQATSEDHFWVWCADARTWAFLSDAPGAVDLGVFHEQVSIEPLLLDDLDAWLLGPVTAAGLRLSFAALASSGTDQVDARAELRARRAYLRVLDDLSQGKPGIARLLWRASLRSGVDGSIEHAVPTLPEGATLRALGDEDLFLLTALVTHAGLDVHALSEVLNRPETRVRSACRRLLTQGILVGDDLESWFDVADVVHPTAVRVLTQRAFLDIS